MLNTIQYCSRTDGSGHAGQRSEQNSLSPIQRAWWFWTEVTLLVLRAGWIMSPDGWLFQQQKGKFLFAPTRTNVQTYISGFVASLPLHKATEKTVLTVQKIALLIPLSAPLCPATLRGFSPWICITDHWTGATDDLAQGWTLEPIISICPHTAALLSPQQLPGDVCGSDPAAISCRSLLSVCPNCSSGAVVGLLTAAFQLGLKTVSRWCFPTRDVLLQIGVQCLRAVDEGGEGIFLSNPGYSTATSQCLLTTLSKLPLHAFCFGRSSLPPWKYNWPQPLRVPSRQGQPARNLRVPIAATSRVR